jgi:hypothetical protein
MTRPPHEFKRLMAAYRPYRDQIQDAMVFRSAVLDPCGSLRKVGLPTDDAPRIFVSDGPPRWKARLRRDKPF